jgi:hypothetical protein
MASPSGRFARKSPERYPLVFLPTMVRDSSGKIYELNALKATVSMSMFRDCCMPIQKHIAVGQHPGPIAINDKTHIVYIGYPQSGTLSVINGFTDKVAVGAIFNVNPPDSGVIKCNGKIYPTNTYVYVDSRTNCTAQKSNGTDFQFPTWTESPLTNRNSSTPIEQSSDHPETITVDRYGIFTANFKLPHQLTPEEFTKALTVITGVISAAVALNGNITYSWMEERVQR